MLRLSAESSVVIFFTRYLMHLIVFSVSFLTRVFTLLFNFCFIKKKKKKVSIGPVSDNMSWINFRMFLWGEACSYRCGQRWWEVTDFPSAPCSAQCCLHCSLDIDLLEERFCFFFQSCYSFRGGRKMILVKPLDVQRSSAASWNWCGQGNELKSV